MAFWSNYWQTVTALPGKFLPLAGLSMTVPARRIVTATAGSPTGSPAIVPDPATPVAPFIHTHFRSSPTAPGFKYVPVPGEIMLSVNSGSDRVNTLAGTIRARPIGDFEGQPIHLIDCFCVRPDWRKRGLGSYLLNSLQTTAAARGKYNAIFLKEGAPLSIFGVHPFYSSIYAYRYVGNLVGERGSPLVRDLSPDLAHRLVDKYALIHPETFMIRSRQATNQKWFYWRQAPESWVIALVQDSYQAFPSDSRPIGWMTGWLESAGLTTGARATAAEAITAAAADTYDWVWLDERWCGDSRAFARDCQFHWYSYQWATSLVPGQSYCIMA